MSTAATVRRTLIQDPAAIPVLRVDRDQPAVPGDRLVPDALRRCFPVRSDWLPERPGDGVTYGDRSPAQASVLVPLVVRDGALGVLLTRRTAHLHDHAGQISFPGGRRDPDDADALATALREAEEEIGLDPQGVEVLGCLPIYTTVSGFEVTPVVALIPSPPSLKLDAFEVATAFEVPLGHLMNPANHRHHLFADPEGDRTFLSMPWRGADWQGSEDDFFIWGATAAMLRNLYAWLVCVDA
jgi:8-oxo-dGTP pyrophosphatase MutT (NUDIX family)